MTDITFDWDSLLQQERPEPTAPLIARRYRLGEELASGGHGQIFRGEDLYPDSPERTDVVIKLEPVGSHEALERVRRELTALRLLRLPNVVRVLDDGLLPDGQHFIAMQFVDGEPFPLKGPWQQLRPLFLTLLDTLRTIHEAGVVHRDIKPSNILVRAGRPVLLDFGLARQEPVLDRVEGTPRYMAPEQLLGTAADHRVDLYAVGCMLFECLSGHAPHGHDIRRIILERPRVPAPALRTLVPDVDPKLADLVDRLLSIDPSDRPSDAEQVYRSLGGDSLAQTVVDLTDALPRRPTREDLEGLWVGPEFFSHLKSIPAQALLDRSDGTSEDIRRLLERWLRSGVAHLERGRLKTTRLSLRELELREGLDPADPHLVDALLERAEAAYEAGQHTQVRALLELALGVARHGNSRPQEARILRWLTASTAASASPEALDRSLAQLGRAEERGIPIAPLRELLRAKRMAIRRETGRALSTLRRCGEFGFEPLELARASVLIEANAHSVQDLELQIQSMETWASTPERRARLLRWRSALAYREGDYQGAMDWALQSVELDPSRNSALSGLNRAASAALECAPERGKALIAQFSEAARALAEPHRELTAWMLSRALDYRLGIEHDPQPHAVRVARDLYASVALGCAMTEMAFAWRQGHEAALPLALEAAHLAEILQNRDAQIYSRCMATSLGHATPNILGEARSIRDPELRAEALALIAPRFPRKRLRGEVQAAVDASNLPLHQRRTILSMQEALDRCKR